MKPSPCLMTMCTMPMAMCCQELSFSPPPNLPHQGGGTNADAQFIPWWGSASTTSPLPWREVLGEGEKHAPGNVKLRESPGRAGGLPMTIKGSSVAISPPIWERLFQTGPARDTRQRDLQAFFGRAVAQMSYACSEPLEDISVSATACGKLTPFSN